jgi:dihydrofolate synthase/folylpolyglutamate synthase
VTYSEAIRFLTGLQLFGSHLGLERAFRLAELAGHPEQRLRFIHVAGTNGKGSTCAMLEAIYRAAGLRVGLYTSPHLVSFRERLQINRELIPEADVARLADEAQRWIQQFDHENHATFFEVVTAMALAWFAQCKCDLVVWETGLGGRLDATNVVTPLASVITNVQLDHEKWLGHSLEEIAREKAGIIKPRVPVITAATGAPLDVIRDTARSLISPLHAVHEPASGDIGLMGKHQRINAALATRTVEVLQGALSVPPRCIQAGLEDVRWAGRFQVIPRDGQTVVLDGAHNPAGALSLVEALEDVFGDARFLFIVGVLADKDCAAVMEVFARRACDFISVPVASGRTAQPELLCAAARKANSALAPRCAASLSEGLALARSASHVVVAGSLYLVGEALELLDEASAPGERTLNEWGASPR